MPSKHAHLSTVQYDWHANTVPSKHAHLSTVQYDWHANMLMNFSVRNVDASTRIRGRDRINWIYNYLCNLYLSPLTL